eukprot:ANDGO_02778.mRNA.1 hypothetical protein
MSGLAEDQDSAFIENYMQYSVGMTDPWTADELRTFCNAIMKYGTTNFMPIAREVRSRSLVECLELWSKMTAEKSGNPKLSRLEPLHLVDVCMLVIEHGKHWQLIASILSEKYPGLNARYFHCKYAWKLIFERRSQLSSYLMDLFEKCPRDLALKLLSDKSNFFGLDDAMKSRARFVVSDGEFVVEQPTKYHYVEQNVYDHFLRLPAQSRVPAIKRAKREDVESEGEH